MSRVPVTEVFFKNSVPPTLRRGYEVYLYKRGTSEKAQVFTAESGGEERSQPLVTDVEGRVKLDIGGIPWVAPGNYTFKTTEGTELLPVNLPEGAGTGGPPTGAAGGDLSGEYPNPTIGSEKVTEGKLAALAVSTAKLAASAVTAAKLGAEAVESAAIKALAVTEAKIAGEAVSAAKLATNAVEAVKIKAEAVTTEKLAALAVTAAKLAAESVEEGKIKGEAVSTTKIAALAVTAAKLGAESVETGKIKLLAITEGLLAAEAVGEGKIKALAVTAGKIGSEAVEEGKIKNLAVSEGKLAATSVSNAKIVNETIAEEKLASAVKTKLKGAERTPHSFSMPAATEVKAEVIGTFYQAVASGETKTLIGMKYKLASGEKAKFSIKQNGTAVTGFKELEAKSAEELAVSGKSVAVADLDRFELNVESITGTPKGITVTLFFETTH